LQPDKHENYLLAAMPPFTLLACQTWARVMAKIRRGVLQLPAFAMWGGLAAAVALGVWLFVSIAPRWPTAQRDLQWAAICLASSWTAACLWLLRRQWPLAGWTTLAGALGAYVLAIGSLVKAHDRRLPTAEFARQLRQEVLRDEPVCVFAVDGVLRGMNPVVFYLQDPVCRASTTDDLWQRLNEHDELLVVTEQHHVPMLASIAHVDELSRMAPPPNDSDREPPLACVRLRQRY
ncbi:MAG TPA: hypothetical protein VK137_04985, partial [Planctomycetaceae bacterium]|nr:hypothetical protein [Planctomycetaceae bacterium]